MLRRVTRPTLRFGSVVLLVGALGLGGCVSNSYSLGGSDYGEPLTPAQAALRDQTDRFNETVGTGVAAGAILGALLGAAVDSDDRGRGAAIGALAGGALGGVSGYYIATENESYANTEQALDARIAAAQREADSYRKIASSSARVAADNRQRLIQLEQQYRNGQISAKQYRDRTASMQDDLRLMDEALANANDVRQKIGQDAGSAGGYGRQSLNQSGADIGRSAAQIARSRDELARALAAAPDA